MKNTCVKESGIGYLNECIKQSYIEGNIPESTYLEMVGIVEENPITTAKKFLQQIKLIKDCKPDEYVGEVEVKKFVDKNYDTLKKVAEYMDEEPSSLKTKLSKTAIATCVSWAIALVGMITASSGALLVTGIVAVIIGFIGTIIGAVASYMYMRASEVDRDVVDNLSKIKRSLKTVDKKKLKDDTAKKLTTIIDKIEDAETSWNAQVKTESATTYEDVAQNIFEAYKDNKISQEQKNQLLGALVESENAKLVQEAEAGSISSTDKALAKKRLDTSRIVNAEYNKKSNPNDTSASAISNDISNIIKNLQTIQDVLSTTKDDSLKSIKRDILKVSVLVNTTVKGLSGKQA